jgi:NAD(P)-dependent dehydrogenase (short-subunit alcohol dehydrogenase family)
MEHTAEREQPEMVLAGFHGRVALVTGARRGIGLCIAETLARLGATVAAADLEAPTIPGVLGIAIDVRDEASVDAAFTEVEARLGPVGMLVLNAGVIAIEPLEETSLDSWRRTFDVNLTGAFLCARRGMPNMRAAGHGRVVAIGSSAGKTGGASNAAAYAASKAGIMTLARSIASEYARFGITSNALAPALIETGMLDAMADMRDRIPVGRLGRVQDVADTVAFLCSDHASFITGEVVDVNGGFLID